MVPLLFLSLRKSALLWELPRLKMISKREEDVFYFVEFLGFSCSLGSNGLNSRVWRKTFDFEELGIALLAMGAVKLELRCPQNENGIIAADPEPDWSFEALVSELNSLELKLNSSSIFPIPFTKTESRGLSNVKKGPTAFVMRVSDDEMEDVEREGGVEEVYDRSLVAGSRFACDELYLSDSDDESNLHDQFHLMDKAGVAEGIRDVGMADDPISISIFDGNYLEEVRTQISVLETDLTHERKKSTSAIVRVEKYIEARREMDRKLDIQYQRNIAEALDNHMTAVQRDHEHRSQIEERRIRNEAAFEEARKEKALQEEKLRQEKAKAEAKVSIQVRLELAAKKRAEEAKIAALEDERRAAKEAAEREGIGASTRAATEVAPKEATGHQRDASLGILNAQLNGSKTDGTKKAQSAGNILKSAESALKLEQERLQKYKEFDEKTQALGQSSNKLAIPPNPEVGCNQSTVVVCVHASVTLLL
ncbi:Protein GLE1 [Vitis vinifera]|uniref:Protein GLE1 n=1 Tax=Vitis vinifera TaxID=29760 RepID=A0A438J650_VITVI|nr:Protein GLE1 [Vitis vinifera]